MPMMENPFLRGMLGTRMMQNQERQNQMQQALAMAQLQRAAREEEESSLTAPLRRALLQSQVNQAQQDADVMRAYISSRGLLGNAPQSSAPLAFGAGGVSLPGGGQGNMQTGQVVPAAQAAPSGVPQAGGLPPHVQLALLHPRLQALGRAEAEAFKPTDRQRDALALGYVPGTPQYNAYVGTQFNQGGAWQFGPQGQLNLAPGYAAGQGEVEGAQQRERARYDLVTVPSTAPNQPPQYRSRLDLLPQPQAAPTPIPGYSPQEQQAINLVQSGQATSARPTAAGAEIVRPIGQPIPTSAVIPNAAGMSPQQEAAQRASNVYGDRVAGQSAERDVTQHNAASSAVENINKIDTMINHLSRSDAITGMGAEVMLNVERARQLISENAKRGKRISDTELLDVFLGSDVFPMIQSLGIGARGMDTPAEREFLRKVMTGTIDLNKATLMRMAQIRRDIATRAVQRWNSRVESGELDRYFSASGMNRAPIEIPPAPDIGGAITDAGREQMPASGAPAPGQWGIRRLP